MNEALSNCASSRSSTQGVPTHSHATPPAMWTWTPWVSGPATAISTRGPSSDVSSQCRKCSPAPHPETRVWRDHQPEDTRSYPMSIQAKNGKAHLASIRDKRTVYIDGE